MVVAVRSYRLRLPYGSSPNGSYCSADLASVFKKLGHPSHFSIRKLGPTRKDSTAFDFAMPLAGKVPFTLSAV